MKENSEIVFIQDGEIKRVSIGTNGIHPTTTVLNYLRNSSDHKGTKEGCAEGDCGACTVVIAEIAETNKLKYTAIDSCLVFMPMLHGKQLLTVENLKADEKLHPVQQEMVDKNGSQCGYCTPGFVMSLFALFKENKQASQDDIRDALTGNLCRCTGYRPIIEAASSACAQGNTDHFSKMEYEVIQKLKLIHSENNALSHTSSEQSYFQPTSIQEALKLLSEHPDALLIQGATDVALRVTKKHEVLPKILDLSAVSGLKTLQDKSNEMVFGSGMSLEAVKENTEHTFPALYKMLAVFGSRQIRSLATLGGNLGSASPIGDTLPVLMALNARIELQSLSGKREIRMNEFVIGYRKTQKQGNEIISAVIIPKMNKDSIISSYKVSKRKDLDISTVSSGFSLKFKNDEISEAILAYGGMAEKTKRATSAESFLIGKKWTRENAEKAGEFVYSEYTPLSDARSGAEFRRLAARNLVLKFWDETHQH
ncbi:MAG: xanthine dehydrogenase small subunit [Bacteroidetes bacterium]|nr:xanthine dehydrogenase small subunit [Bacteroidota bacterium]